MVPILLVLAFGGRQPGKPHQIPQEVQGSHEQADCHGAHEHLAQDEPEAQQVLSDDEQDRGLEALRAQIHGCLLGIKVSTILLNV